MSKPLVIYHTDCADGFGAAFAAWLKFGDEAEYLPVQYNQFDGPPLDDTINRDVYILDFSFPKDQMELIIAGADRVVWLDHHKTAFEMFCETERVYWRQTGLDQEGRDVFVELDNNRSGALIAWEYFHPGAEVPMLIKHIDDYDRWQFKLEGTEAFNKALWSYAPWNFEQWNQLLNDGETYWKLRDEGVALLRAHNQNVQSVVKAAAMPVRIFRWSPFANAAGSVEMGFTRYSVHGLAANCPPHLHSDVGHELANKSGTFALLWNMQDDGRIKCGLRSVKGYDVSAIAKAFGGGGHENSAGFYTDIETLMGWLG